MIDDELVNRQLSQIVEYLTALAPLRDCPMKTTFDNRFPDTRPSVCSSSS